MGKHKTSPAKPFTRVKHFSAAALGDLDDLINTWIHDYLDADYYQYYSVRIGSSFFDGSVYCCAIQYDWFEIDSNWIPDEA